MTDYTSYLSDFLDFVYYRFSTPALVLSIVAGSLLVLQFLYHLIVYGKIVYYKKRTRKQNSRNEAVLEPIGVSLVFVVNHNSRELQDQLLLFLEQDYPLYEVVVVNEAADDESSYILCVLQREYKHLKVINLQDNANKFSDRKFSLSIGIRSAFYDTIVIGDIVCRPPDLNWLGNLVKPMNNNNKKILLGFSALTRKDSVLNQFTQYYHLTMTMNSMGFAMLGLPFSADGKNMIYNKQFFFKKGGLIAQYRKSCYQEDYFVSRHANKRNTAVNLAPSSFVYAPAWTSYSAFKRNAYARFLSHKTFSFFTRLRLAFLPLTSVLFYLAFAGALIVGVPWQYCLQAFILKWIMQSVYYFKCIKQFKTRLSCFFVPFYELYFILFNFKLRLKKTFHRKKKHKIRWN